MNQIAVERYWNECSQQLWRLYWGEADLFRGRTFGSETIGVVVAATEIRKIWMMKPREQCKTNNTNVFNNVTRAAELVFMDDERELELCPDNARLLFAEK
jgi:hypothetical protein